MDVLPTSVNQIRDSWTVGCDVMIFSTSRSQWFDGTIARIFNDEEGEWLEICYNNSMLKQIQRYNPELMPTQEQKKAFAIDSMISHDKPIINYNETTDISYETAIRMHWVKGNEIEVFDTINNEWNIGEIVDIMYDNEGEWLCTLWHRCNYNNNNTNDYDTMYQQFGRLSTNIRPITIVSNEDDICIDTAVDTTADDPIDSVESVDSSDFEFDNVRRCPSFELSNESSTFSYPASAVVRTKERCNLENVNESTELETKYIKYNNLKTMLEFEDLIKNKHESRLLDSILNFSPRVHITLLSPRLSARIN